MAQGKLKVKNKSKVPTGKVSSKKGGKVIKKAGKGHKAKGVGPANHKSSKTVEIQLQKFKKEIRKNINNKIEQELGKKALQVEEGRPFAISSINNKKNH